MPIKIERIEPYIYRSTWEGALSLDEILGGRMEAMAKEHDELPYVAIVDTSNVRKVPFNIAGLRNVDLEYTTREVYLVQPPPTVSVIATILNRLLDKNFIEVTSYEDALDHARDTVKRAEG